MRSPVPKVRTSTWWRYFSGTARRWWCLKDSGWRSMPGRDPVVTFGQEGVLEAFGGEVALLLRDPFLQPAVRQDLQRHRVLPASVDQR